VPTDRAAATREAILVTAERLMAEQGILAVSNRQISEAAGQGNTAAVGYHFGSKQDLVRAVIRRHSADVERRRAELVAAVEGSERLADWLDCLVRPVTDHLDSLGSPTWFARFALQAMAEPATHAVVVEETATLASVRRALDGLRECLSDLPPEVLDERRDMMRELMMTVPAARERALADGLPTPRATWREAADGLVDALTGLLQAPPRA
jgi:AcrR family transcriptional regulator